MLICIDFDDTYTADIPMWNSIIQVMQRNGHDVICCTMRHPNEGLNVKKTIGQHCKVYYSSRKAKMEYLKELNVHPDIWIDDNPDWLFQDG